MEASKCLVGRFLEWKDAEIAHLQLKDEHGEGRVMAMTRETMAQYDVTDAMLQEGIIFEVSPQQEGGAVIRILPMPPPPSPEERRQAEVHYQELFGDL